MDERREYQTEDLIVYWDSTKCIHAGKCWQVLPEVFRPKERPWVSMAAATPEQIIATIDKCPSHALQYKVPEGSKADQALAAGPGSKRA